MTAINNDIQQLRKTDIVYMNSLAIRCFLIDPMVSGSNPSSALLSPRATRFTGSRNSARVRMTMCGQIKTSFDKNIACQCHKTHLMQRKCYQSHVWLISKKLLNTPKSTNECWTDSMEYACIHLCFITYVSIR